jgi:hypothetical protein
LRNPCCYFFWHTKFAFYKDFKSAHRKEAISLMSLAKNSNSENLYSKPECHVVLKAFSISKNTAAINILLLKFRVMRSTSLIHISVIL